ncbi:MAG: peptide MFS transporter, partial [Planctomycetes bacterium]|nr:peptide MFS transporter [Planctomycetota bacterium]
MLKNHPRGLMVLFFTEMWERFGFYIMMAIFYLYMDKSLGWNDERKGSLYGAFLGMVYFIPILGGFLGDRVLGQRHTIRLGAVLMMFGYAALTFSSLQRLALFYVGLLLVAVGTGLFKANISVLVGNLYEEGSQFKDAAFNIFYMGVNLGAALAPLAATFISVRYGSYNLSFAAAAVGMAISLFVFQIGRRHLVPAHAGGLKATASAGQSVAVGSRAEDWQRIASLFTLFLIAIFFWVAFYQNGSSLTLFAERSTAPYSLTIPLPSFLVSAFGLRSSALSFSLKPETYQVFNPLFILLLTPVLVAIFARMRKKGLEPSSASKIFAGMAVMGFSVLIMVFAARAGGDLDQNIMSPWWLISSYFAVTVSELLVSPMGLSYVSKVAPARMRGLMMGCWFGSTAVGSYGSGLLAKYYGEFSHHAPCTDHR